MKNKLRLKKTNPLQLSIRKKEIKIVGKKQETGLDGYLPEKNELINSDENYMVFLLFYFVEK